MDRCEHCGFDFDKSGLVADVSGLVRGPASGDEEDFAAPKVFCPVCGTPAPIPLARYGIFYRKAQASYIRWIASDQPLPRPEKAEEVKIGESFTLTIPGLMNKHLADICYPAVPVFKEAGDRGLKLPDLPVRKDFFDCLALSDRALPSPGVGPDRSGRKRYAIGAIPVTACAVPETDGFSLPLMDAIPGREAFEGVNLDVWPKVASPGWKCFFIRLCTDSAARSTLFGDSRRVRLFVQEPVEEAFSENGRERTREVLRWKEACDRAADGETLLYMSESRPLWVAIEFYRPGQDEPLAGGVFRFPAADPARAYVDRGDPRQIGMDFGTSNTCLAMKDEDGRLQLLAPAELTFSLVEGIAGDPFFDRLSTWPLSKGFGEDMSFVPSEIITNLPLTEMTARRDFGNWRPVLDYGITRVTAGDKKAGEGRTIWEFKWPSSERGALYGPDSIRHVQEHYIRFVLLLALARLAQETVPVKSVSISHSYPLAFDEDRRNRLVEAFASACRYLERLTGMSLSTETDPEQVKDEAMAAGALAGAAEVGDLLFVDIGGGSTDVAYFNFDMKAKIHVLFLTSFQYAGSGLLSALGKDCLAQRATLEDLRARIRSAQRTADVLNSSDVVRADMKERAKRRTVDFYLYLKEYLARLVAARLILNLENTYEGFKSEYPVSLFFLGNGWGFGSFLNAYAYSDEFAETLGKRVEEILSEFAAGENEKPAAYPGPYAGVKVVPRFLTRPENDKKRIHPKAAVACGLLVENTVKRQHMVEAEGRKQTGWRKIMGHDVSLGADRYPWFLPLDFRLRYPKEILAEGAYPLIVERRVVQWNKEALPSFPKDFYKPHEIDEEMRQMRQKLATRLVSASNPWFAASPFEILLEDLYKTHLGAIA